MEVIGQNLELKKNGEENWKIINTLVGNHAQTKLRELEKK